MRGPISGALQRFQLFERARPILAQQPRQTPVGQQLAAGLAAQAVVGLIGRITNALHRFATP